MRAVKSVLVMSGGLKRGEPDAVEDTLLIRAMRDSNVPKFLSHDLPLFFAIVQDLFPGVDVPYVDYGALQTAIEGGLQSQSLQVHDSLVTKIIQLFETLMVRFGVMLVGPTLGGKTTNYKTLALALTTLREDNSDNEKYQRAKYTVFNPKSITMGELYGEFNEMTQEWTDGLGSKIMRGFVNEENPDYKFTVFDGPVDAIWIENMNTVLDDNMTLCLANGERVKLNWTMRIINITVTVTTTITIHITIAIAITVTITVTTTTTTATATAAAAAATTTTTTTTITTRMLFEVEDLKVASPATVSRCGMVYLTAPDLGWEPYVKTWCAALPDE